MLLPTLAVRTEVEVQSFVAGVVQIHLNVMNFGKSELTECQSIVCYVRVCYVICYSDNKSRYVSTRKGLGPNCKW